MRRSHQRTGFRGSLIAVSATLALAAGCSSNPRPAPELSTLPNSQLRSSDKMKVAGSSEPVQTVDVAGAAAATGASSVRQPIGTPTTETRALGKSSPASAPSGGSQVPASNRPANNLIPQLTANPSISSPNGTAGVIGDGSQRGLGNGSIVTGSAVTVPGGAVTTSASSGTARRSTSVGASVNATTAAQPGVADATPISGTIPSTPLNTASGTRVAISNGTGGTVAEVGSGTSATGSAVVTKTSTTSKTTKAVASKKGKKTKSKTQVKATTVSEQEIKVSNPKK